LTAAEQDRGQVTSNGHKTWTDDFLATGPALHIIEGFSLSLQPRTQSFAEQQRESLQETEDNVHN